MEVRITPDSFRPNTPWASDQDDYVIVARDPEATHVAVTWSLTEGGNDDVTGGDLEITTGAVIDASQLLKRTFLDEE